MNKLRKTEKYNKEKVKPKHSWAQKAQGLERGVPRPSQRKIPPAKHNK